MSSWAVGVDLGGTNIRAAKVDGSGQISHSTFVEIDRDFESHNAFAQVLSIVENIISSEVGNPPLGIGIGVTGPIDVETGIIDNPFTLPAQFQGNIKEALQNKFNLNVVVENDANAACIGEAIFGAGAGAEVVVCLTVGTGIGVGVLNNGIIYRGVKGAHPEAGHIQIDATGPLCYCGKYGCLESLTSGTSLREIGLGRGIISAGQTGRDLAMLAEQGDQGARKVFEDVNRYLEIGVANLISTYGPEVVVLTGGAIDRSQLLLTKLQQGADEGAKYTNLKTEIKFGELGDWAGTVGAATRVLRNL
jgi:glucokinase